MLTTDLEIFSSFCWKTSAQQFFQVRSVFGYVSRIFKIWHFQSVCVPLLAHFLNFDSPEILVCFSLIYLLWIWKVSSLSIEKRKLGEFLESIWSLTTLLLILVLLEFYWHDIPLDLKFLVIVLNLICQLLCRVIGTLFLNVFGTS